MLVIGLILALIAAAYMVWGSDDASSAVVLGVIGIVFIAIGSRDRRNASPH
jgi:hypothetical protein